VALAERRPAWDNAAVSESVISFVNLVTALVLLLTGALPIADRLSRKTLRRDARRRTDQKKPLKVQILHGSDRRLAAPHIQKKPANLHEMQV
jgi:hypothetical protein